VNEYLQTYIWRKRWFDRWWSMEDGGDAREAGEQCDAWADANDEARKRIEALNESARIARKCREDARKVTPKMAALRSNPALLLAH
jgi:hypothetical protein